MEKKAKEKGKKIKETLEAKLMNKEPCIPFTFSKEGRKEPLRQVTKLKIGGLIIFSRSRGYSSA
jgi:hypothetical protein